MKEIKTEIHKCIPCEKVFNPSCVKLYKVCNTEKELIPCKGKVYVTKPSANVGAAAGGSGKEAKALKSESCRTTDSSMDSRIEICIIVKEMRDEMVGKQLLKKAIMEAVEEEMDKVR